MAIAVWSFCLNDPRRVSLRSQFFAVRRAGEEVIAH